MKLGELAAAVLAALAIAGVPLAAIAYERTQHPDELTVVARLHPRGGWSPAEIRVRKGELVRLRITSEDVTHSLAIPKLRVDSGPIEPGHWVRVEFVADRDGTLKFYCGVACGPHHTHMTGQLVVDDR